MLDIGVHVELGKGVGKDSMLLFQSLHFYSFPLNSSPFDTIPP